MYRSELKAACILIGLFLISLSVPAKADMLDADLQQFMVEQYGSYDPSDSTWGEETDQTDMGKPVIAKYKICARKAVSTADGPRIMLGICYVSGAPSITGIASDFYVLKRINDAHVSIVLSLTQDQYAGPGNCGPVDIKIEKLGPRLYGFIENSRSVNQGYATEDAEIYLPWKGRIVPAGGFITNKTNKNAFLRREMHKNIDDVSVIMNFEDSSQSADVYPLLLREQGVEKGRKISRSFRAPFDPVAGEYNLPRDMIQGW